MSLNEQVSAIQSREDFIRFVQALANDLAHNSEQWENETLPRYLEAVAAWTEDMDGYFKNRGEVAPKQPDWKTLGLILLAAKSYE